MLRYDKRKLKKAIFYINSKMIELEKTYLAKYLPKGLKESKSKKIIDIYLPKLSEHPKLRIRQNGDKFVMTKKELLDKNDASAQREQNINLSEEEFKGLKAADGKTVSKTRYYYDYNGRIAEIDVFDTPLRGLIVVDFEFETVEEKDAFPTPDFCLIDITQELFIAGGMLAGKGYEDIEENLNKFDYQKIILE